MAGVGGSERAARERGSRTRRRLLAGAAGVLGVAAVEVAGRAAPAQADTGNPVLQGIDNGYPTHRTAVFTPNNTEVGILADPNSSGKGSLGVYGIGQDTGVLGEGSGSGTGVQGFGGNGVFGQAASGGGGTGVQGLGGGVDGIGVAGTGGGNGPGVHATANGSGTGVIGLGGPSSGVGVSGFGGGFGTGVTGKGGAGSGTGVTGTGGSGNGAGVRGNATGSGTGMVGQGGPSSGVGVSGQGGGSAGHGVTGSGGGTGAGMWGTGGGSGGPGVRGTAASASGAGVLAENTAGGTALQVSGPAVFAGSGILTVAAGSSKATKTGVTLTSASLVLVTLQQHATGVYVLAAVPNTAGSSFTVYLSQAVSAATKVAWFVVN
jgi:hypothetical protein